LGLLLMRGESKLNMFFLSGT